VGRGLLSFFSSWPGVPEDDERRKEWTASESRVTTSYLPINRGWPSIEGGVEVTVEVCSDASKPKEECSACRSLMILDCFSVFDLLRILCHSVVGTSFGSYTPSSSCGGTDQIVLLLRYVACSSEQGVGG
jgi:hypothetical protein